MEYGQVNGEIRVDVRDLCEFLIHGYLYAQILPALPDQGLFFRFAGFYLAACKFPQQSPGFVGRALADHECSALPKQSCHYFRHGRPPSFLWMLSV